MKRIRKSFFAVGVGLFLILGSGMMVRSQESGPTISTPETPPAAGDTAKPEEPVIQVSGAPVGNQVPEIDPTAGPAILSRNERERRDLSLAQILETAPGVAVLEQGGPEGPWYLTIRGSGPMGVAVYLDGILLSDPSGRPVDLARIPLDLVESVAVYRGFIPAGYPINGTQGVIDIRTRAESATRAFQAKAAAASRSQYSVTASATGRVMSGAGLIGAAQAFGSDRFPYPENRGDSAHHSADHRATRSNNAYNDASLLAKWELRRSGYKVYTSVFFQRRDHELPGQGGENVSDARARSELILVAAGLKRPGVLSPNLDAEIRLNFLQERFWLDDLTGEVGAPTDERSRRTRISLDLFLYYFGIKSHRPALYFSLAQEEFRPRSDLDPLLEKVSASRAGLYLTLADRISLWDNRLTFQPRLRYAYEGSRYSGPTLVGRSEGSPLSSSANLMTLDLSAGLSLTRGLRLTVQFGQNYRSPTYLEQFGDRAVLRGDPDLAAEHSLNQEYGLRYHPGPLFGFDTVAAELLFYQSDFHERIGWTALAGRRLAAENLGEARVQGVEASFHLNRQDLILIEAAYAWQASENLSHDARVNGNDLPGLPRNTFHLGLCANRSYGRIFYDFYYQDTRFLDEANRIPAHPRLIHNLGLAYYRGRWSLGFEAENLADDQRPEMLGYPVPGRRYIIFVEVNG